MTPSIVSKCDIIKENAAAKTPIKITKHVNFANLPDKM